MACKLEWASYADRTQQSKILSALNACPGGQPIAMRSKEIVDKRPYLIEIEFGGLVRIRHRRMVDLLRRREVQS